jgi:hypothetical protein
MAPLQGNWENTMANEEQLRVLNQGVAEWNRWREKHGRHLADEAVSKLPSGWAPYIPSSIRGGPVWGRLNPMPQRWYSLSGVDLAEANLRGRDLRSANLWGADLSGANLIGANLSEANLNRANLDRANLSEANLSRANLYSAHLSGANLSGAKLDKANLEKSVLDATTFGYMDLSVATGLDSVWHLGPSTVGVDTLYMSGGRIPKAFLRGAGVPEEMVVYLQSLLGRAIEFYSCFISYSSKDQDFAERLHADLQDKGVRCWFAPKDVQGGRKLHEQIDEAIRYHDKLLLVLSENSIGSEWVKTEIRRARREEVKAGRRMLFPISLAPFSAVRDWEAFDADIGKDMAVEVREYFIPDFCNWKDHDAYQKAFTRLLHDLKTETVHAPESSA